MKTPVLTLLALAFLASPLFAQKGERRNDTVTTPSGLRYVIVKQGRGKKPLPGNVVIAHYTGTFLDGKVFDSSREREPFAFTLGRGQVIKGWDEAFALLRVGDRATLIIPPTIAYGDKQRGSIPANSTLVFDVELIDLKDRALSDLLAFTDSTSGIDSTVRLYHNLKRFGFTGYYMSEAQINGLGYQLLRQEKIHAAIEIFKLNVDAFPESFNVYDSLGEAYAAEAEKQRALAIINYKRALELNKENANAVEMLKKLEGR